MADAEKPKSTPAAPDAPESREDTPTGPTEAERTARREGRETEEAKARVRDAEESRKIEEELYAPDGRAASSTYGTGTNPDLNTGMEQAGKSIETMWGKITSAINALGTTGMKNLRGLFAMLGFESGVAWLDRQIKPAEIRDLMQRAFGKDKLQATPEDDASVDLLDAQWKATIEGSDKKKTEATYPFQMFIWEKIKLLKAAGSRASYTIADLVEPKSEEMEANERTATERKAKEADEAKRTAERKERLEENIDVKRAVHIFALAKSLNKVKPGFLTIEETELKKDEAGRKPGDGEYYYKKLVDQILEKFAPEYSSIGVVRTIKSSSIARYRNAMLHATPFGAMLMSRTEGSKAFGIQINSGVLEEYDGNVFEWSYANIDSTFMDDLQFDPAGAIQKLLDFDFKDSGVNALARSTMPAVQDALRKELALLGLQEAAKPVEVAAATPETKPDTATA